MPIGASEGRDILADPVLAVVVLHRTLALGAKGQHVTLVAQEARERLPLGHGNRDPEGSEGSEPEPWGPLGPAKTHRYIGILNEGPLRSFMVNSIVDCTPYTKLLYLRYHSRAPYS